MAQPKFRLTAAAVGVALLMAGLAAFAQTSTQQNTQTNTQTQSSGGSSRASASASASAQASAQGSARGGGLQSGSAGGGGMAGGAAVKGTLFLVQWTPNIKASNAAQVVDAHREFIRAHGKEFGILTEGVLAGQYGGRLAIVQGTPDLAVRLAQSSPLVQSQAATYEITPYQVEFSRIGLMEADLPMAAGQTSGAGGSSSGGGSAGGRSSGGGQGGSSGG
ncbi:MAG: hypothetical protein JNM28_10460 [Armatimonadetes bacterium]|nr:hypothetical protein [Armatimonadota bacterium]MBS1710514.1 hypothetical protein [Armatimonadota bacterium]MBX3108185.1 hypothetical protein [Fimbriimonadaceae bacterium]